jgi:hypothetical protein
LRDSLRYDAIERCVGRVERAREVGCVEDISDTPSPKLERKLGDLGGERDGL